MGVARARRFGHTKWATLFVPEWHLRGLGRNFDDAHVTIRPPPILHGRVPRRPDSMPLPKGAGQAANTLLRSDWAYRAAICHGLGLC